MRSLTASAFRPPTLRDRGEGGKEAARHRQQKERNPSVSLSFPTHWAKPDVRGALYARHGRVWAYCGCYLPRNDKGDVEHFRPKGKVVEDATHGGYWWLAYELSNYLISCNTCNRVHKRDRFPLRSAASQRITYQTRQRLPNEARLLLHPFDVDRRHGSLEQWFQVDWRAANCFIHPKAGLPPTLRGQVQGTLDFFHINRDPRLIKERNGVRDAILEALDNGEEAKAKAYAIRFRSHSLVARQIFEDQNKRDLIPTPVEELGWFIREELDLLSIALTLLNRTPEDETRFFTAQEHCWILAAVWCDPPVGLSSEVECWLPEEWRGRLQPFVDRLA